MTRDLTTEGPVPGQERIDVGALRHMSLCTGYGGIDIALERAFGAETVAVSDIDPGACKILAQRYPHVPNIGDMTSVDWREWVGKVDIISGGTPCQDLSSAGRRRGMTEGTRSNLWVAMRDAIATIRPQLIVWENVRGAYSAPADSDLESCAGCVGTPGQHGPVLRALGRVLGDLSDLGYDSWWYGLRASDVGAAHQRYRVFVFAVRAEADGSGRGREWWLNAVRRHAHRPGRADGLRGAGEPAASVTALPTPAVNDMGEGKTVEWWDEWTAKMQAKHGNGNGHGKSLAIEAMRVGSHLPSPRTSDTNGAGHHGTGGPDLRTVVAHMPTPMVTDANSPAPADARRDSPQLRWVTTILPTPRATDGTKGGPNQRGSSGDVMLPSATASLPTPRATRGGSSTETAELATSQDWREYEPAIRRQEAAFGYPAPLPTEPTPASRKKCAIHGDPQEGRPTEELRDMRSAADAQEVRERPPGGPKRFPAAAPLLSELRQHEAGHHEVGARLSSETAPEGGMRDLWGDPVDERPTAPCASHRSKLGERRADESDDAVRLVPLETPLARGSGGATGVESVGEGCTCKPWLSAEFSSWLMGLEPGWITDTPGITRNEALKAAGNGVVPQQCEAAARRFLADYAREVAA